MEEHTYTLNNSYGLHIRAAAKLAGVAARYQSDILLHHKSRQVNAKSILGLISLGAKVGDEITISCNGPDENEASEAIQALLYCAFDEA